jgi:hypothetical protein
MLIERAMALTCWSWFLREGKAITLPAPGVVDQTVVPDVSEDWISLGKISTWMRKQNKDAKDLLGPTVGRPGQLVRTGRIVVSATEDYEFEAQEMTALALGVALGAADELTAATETFVPGATFSVEGWLKMQNYTNRNENFFNRNFWCQLECEIPQGGKDVIMPKWTAYVIGTDVDLASGTEA